MGVKKIKIKVASLHSMTSMLTRAIQPLVWGFITNLVIFIFVFSSNLWVTIDTLLLIFRAFG